MNAIYEADGPRWTDSDGVERSGWPHDGFRHRLYALDHHRFELRTEHRHIDGDGLQEDRTPMTRADAIEWLLSCKPTPLSTLAQHFPEHRDVRKTS